MKKFKILLLVLIILVVGSACNLIPEPLDNTGAVKGYIYLDNWDILLESETIVYEENGASVTTNSGFFLIDNIPAGENTITVEALYNDTSVTVNIEPSETTRQDIRVPFDLVYLDYFDQLVQTIRGPTTDGTRRWPLGTKLQIYFETDQTPDTYEPEHKKYAWQAVQKWTNNLGDTLNAVETSNRSAADITIEWQDLRDEDYIGYCRYSWNKDFEIIWAEIVLGTEYSSGKGLALHEVGHALRLGHSYNMDDVMYPYLTSEMKVSDIEAEAVQILYSIPTKLDLTAEVEALTTGEAGVHTEYIKEVK